MNLNATLVAQMLVFLVLAWFTMKFVWPPLIQALDERSQKIAEGLQAAEQSRTALDKAKEQADQTVAQARLQGQQRVAEAEKRAEAIAIELREQAQLEARRIVAQAKAEAEQQFVQARAALRNDVAALAVKGAQQILQREIDSKAHADLLRQLTAGL